VLGQADKLFVYVGQALESEALQGQTASRVATAMKSLLAATNVDPTPLLQQFSPEAQQTIMGYFS
jgi:importin-5